MNDIQKLRYWTFKILPLVYDDSLSYYEVLAKVTSKLNELVEYDNTLNSNIQQTTVDIVKEQLDSEGLATKIFNSLAGAIATDEGDYQWTHENKTGGELIWLDGTLYKVTKVMTTGDAYSVGSNIEEVKISDELASVKKYLTGIKNEYWNTQSAKAYNTGVYLFWKDTLYKTTKDIAVNDILATSGNGANLTEVNLGSEITNHYFEMKEADENLQTQIDNNENDIETKVNNIETKISDINSILAKQTLHKTIRPLLVGHRGASASAPQNTVASLYMAKIAGMDAAEIDVQLTADNQVVVCHDNNLNSLTGTDVNIGESKWSDISSLHISGGQEYDKWPASMTALERFSAIYNVAKTLNLPLVIELKTETFNATNCQYLVNVLVQHDPYINNVILISFSEATLKACLALRPDLKVIWLTSPTTEHMDKALADGFVGIDIPLSQVTATVVNQAHVRGLIIGCWVITAPTTNEQRNTIVNSEIDFVTANDAWPLSYRFRNQPPYIAGPLSTSEIQITSLGGWVFRQRSSISPYWGLPNSDYNWAIKLAPFTLAQGTYTVSFVQPNYVQSVQLAGYLYDRSAGINHNITNGGTLTISNDAEVLFPYVTFTDDAKRTSLTLMRLGTDMNIIVTKTA